MAAATASYSNPEIHSRPGELPHPRPLGSSRRLEEGHFSGVDGHSNHPHLYALKVRLVHTKNSLGKFRNIINPNHRHDEPHEQRIDKWRASIAEKHRFGSFAPETSGNLVKPYVDGRDYFHAVSVALDQAKESIYIADWWLSPELYLRRPAKENEEWRLDKLIKRKAEEGVKIFVLVYKEVKQALTCDSRHSKEALQNLCRHGTPGHHNIYVMRHPDHEPIIHRADMTFFWAHHEKFIVIDHELAFIGGLDLCFGRWDTSSHPLNDGAEIWPGQDFNNNRILDFEKVNNWEQNKLDRNNYGRMPWHDVSIGIKGPAVMSIADHFVGRWNFVKRDKYKRSRKRPWLQLRGVADDLVGVQHPAFPVGGYYMHPLHSSDHIYDTSYGSSDVQIVRSSADWSHGIKPKETSIQTAYKSLIESAQHFIYIENQFFISSTGGKQPSNQPDINNTIAASIVTAVVRAHRGNRKLRIIIVIPAIPGFPGDLREDAAVGTRAIIEYQYKSISRGETSIFGRLRKEGIDPKKYVAVFNLRGVDRLPSGEWFTEEIYPHSKVMVVDDERMIVGSANINDRSQVGDHDSELAAVVKDPEVVKGLRKRLWAEHLGLLKQQDIESVGSNGLPPGQGEWEGVEIEVVEDPSDESVWEMWTSRATTNTEVYRNVFHVDPDDNIKSWTDYDKFLPKDEKYKRGHVRPDVGMSEEQVDSELGRIKGALVWMPLHFLEQEKLEDSWGSVVVGNSVIEGVYT